MGKTSFTLEEYEIFLENPFMANFTIDQLNQVIFMHGFSRIWRRPKIELLNALSTIELMRPYRSTLEEEDYVDGGEFFQRRGDFSPTNDQVKRDLEALNWQECQVQAVETVGLAPAAAEKSSGATSSRNSRRGAAVVSVPPTDLLASPIKRRRRSRKRKLRDLGSITGESSAGGEGNYFHGRQEEREGTDIPSAAAVATAVAVVGAEPAAEGASLYVDTYHWEL